LEPRKGTLFVRPLAKDKEREGIFVPSFFEEENEKVSMMLRRGEVVKQNSTLPVKESDVVYFLDGTYQKNNERINQDEFEWNGERLIFVKDEELRAYETSSGSDESCKAADE